VTFTVTVDPNNAFHYAMSQYTALLPLDIEGALVAGAGMIAGAARANMLANGNVDTGALSASIGTLSRQSDASQVTVTVGPSLTEMHPARFNQTKTFNQIGSYLEFGTGPGGPWTWGGVPGSRWEGFFTRTWTGNLPHPFLVPAKDALASSVVDLVKDAVSRRW
jgi:hypothetical protein